MKRCRATIENIPGSPYSQAAKHNTPKKNRESHEDYEVRTWLEKCTVDKTGQITIPAMGLKLALDTTAQKLGIKIPGRRGATFKSFFASGVFCEGDVPLSNGKPLKKS